MFHVTPRETLLEPAREGRKRCTDSTDYYLRTQKCHSGLCQGAKPAPNNGIQADILENCGGRHRLGLRLGSNDVAWREAKLTLSGFRNVTLTDFI